MYQTNRKRFSQSECEQLSQKSIHILLFKNELIVRQVRLQHIGAEWLLNFSFSVLDCIANVHHHIIHWKNQFLEASNES